MKLIAQLKLQPTPDQANALKRTVETANAACDYISRLAWDTRTFGKLALQKLCYQDVRETFGLSAQMVVRALAKVGDAYKLDKQTRRTFRCVSCGCAGHADTIAAENIRVLGRAAVMQPHVSEAAQPSRQGQAHSL